MQLKTVLGITEEMVISILNDYLTPKFTNTFINYINSNISMQCVSISPLLVFTTTLIDNYQLNSGCFIPIYLGYSVVDDKVLNYFLNFRSSLDRVIQLESYEDLMEYNGGIEALYNLYWYKSNKDSVILNDSDHAYVSSITDTSYRFLDELIIELVDYMELSEGTDSQCVGEYEQFRQDAVFIINKTVEAFEFIFSLIDKFKLKYVGFSKPAYMFFHKKPTSLMISLFEE